MERDGREDAGVSRGQNTVYVMPHDWATIAQFLAPLVERLSDVDHTDEVELLVLASDVEAAAAIAAEAAKLTASRSVAILAATTPGRASRLARLRPPRLLVGPPNVVAEMLRNVAVRLRDVKQVCIAWADELAASGQTAALEAIMTEVPKEAARTIVAGELSPAVTELLERYARRARRVESHSSIADPSTIEYVTAVATGRLDALRRLLDDVDPHTALVFAREHDHEVEIRALLHSLGYPAGDGATLHVGLAAAPGTDVAILFDLPASREELREAIAGAQRTIALVQPRQITSLRALAAGGSVKPLTLPESGHRARDQEAGLRRQVEEVLREGQFGRELIALEPLLAEFDGIEIAAAALRLLEGERRARAARPVERAERAEHGERVERVERAAQPMVRLFVSVGERDGARAADLVGAIAKSAGISSAEIGRVDVRESHSIVEVATSVADTVMERVTGVPIRGRRAVVRRDEERPRRPSDRTARDFSRGGDARGPRSDRRPRPDERGGREGRGGGARERGGREERGGGGRERGGREDRGRDRRPPREDRE